MGYYYRNSCSPYDVQATNGGRFTFDTVKQRYEDTVPIRGKRKEQNIRPIMRRDRAWERIIKVDDNEYYVSFDCYAHRTHHNKAITFKVSGDMEYLTVHTPKKMWGQNPSYELYPQEFRSSSVFYFYYFNLPSGFNMVNYRSNKYVQYADKYYTIEKGDITFQRKRGGTTTDWQPLVVHREVRHILDRKKTKEYRAMLEPFMNYYNVMSDMVEEKYTWGYMILGGLHDGNYTHDDYKNMSAEKVMDLFKPCGTPHESWLGITEFLKRKTKRYDHKTHTEYFEKSKAIDYLAKEFFEFTKPCKEVEVELGKLSNDRYKGWYR